jgi:hypothetical protein
MKANMTDPVVIRRDLVYLRELLRSPSLGPTTRKALKDLISETEGRLAELERQSRT